MKKLICALAVVAAMVFAGTASATWVSGYADQYSAQYPCVGCTVTVSDTAHGGWFSGSVNAGGVNCSTGCWPDPWGNGFSVPVGYLTDAWVTKVVNQQCYYTSNVDTRMVTGTYFEWPIYLIANHPHGAGCLFAQKAL